MVSYLGIEVELSRLVYGAEHRLLLVEELGEVLAVCLVDGIGVLQTAQGLTFHQVLEKVVTYKVAFVLLASRG